ncbi:MAG: alpha/beta hydrolase [Verrucomicrobiota bacterium]
MKPLIVALAALLLAAHPLLAADASTKTETAAEKAAKAAANLKKFMADVPPTEADVPYGKHPKQVMHFWKAASDKPTPLLFFIHGGGWGAGDRSSVGSPTVKRALADGISVVSVEYRFIKEATADGVVPPVKGPMLDCARGLQFVRSKSKEWNIDKTRIGASGGSAGACTSLWLAFHDDLADPQSSDPIARESTRLTCAAVSGPQTSLDPQQMREWTPNSRYGAHAFGITGNFDAFVEARAKILPWIKEYSPYELVTADDPPVGLYFGSAPNLGKEEKDPTHSANFGVKLKEQCDKFKVACELVYPGAPDVKNKDTYSFLLSHLKAGAGK